MSSAPTPPGSARRRALLSAAALVLLGTVLFGVGVVAKLRQREPALLGCAAWQVATAGFVCTLGGGLWLRCHVGG